VLRFGVLGPLAVWAGDGRAAGLPELKVRTLLADLLVHAGRPVPASRLIDDLWGEELPANPTNTLQTRVSQLRRALAGAGGGRELVVCRSAGYSLAVEPEAVDAGEFRALLTRARAAADPGTRAAVLAEALDRWRGPAYADFADHPFARAEIERLTEERLAALEERATARLELGEHGALVAELAALVVEHPLRQRLHAAYLRALYGAGRHNEALAEYAGLRDRLAELGLDPDPELAALQQSILRQDPRLAPRPEVRTNLPAALTSLLGRRDAVRQVRQRVAAGRLVTLTGPGGVGKTRLAVEVARQEADGYRDGAWLVELAAVEAGEDATGVAERLVRTVCTVLGLDAGALAAADLEELVEQSGRVPASRPGGREVRLRDREMLLVLDNCEHVIAPAAALAALLLRAAPGLRVLATSREPLEVPGELRWDVPPLELPGPAEADPAALSKSSAVRLFVDRAAGADPAFQLGTGNAHAVTRICRRLDGIPLALELAATRVRGLGVHEVARRLDDRFRLLSAGLRGAPARQQTLRAVIDWSWSLLSGGERVVLRRLSLHADACTLPAAEVICAGDGVDAADLPDLLARLVDRSLLTRIDGPGGARFRLLESIGAYSLERLHESGEHERVLRRHIAYYTGLSTHAEPRLYGHHPLFSYLLERPGPARPRPRPPAPNGSVLSADGTVIGYDCYGEGRPALVLVGGALNDRMTFAPLARALADRFTVFSYDRRGEGGQRRHLTIHSGEGDRGPGGGGGGGRGLRVRVRSLVRCGARGRGGVARRRDRRARAGRTSVHPGRYPDTDAGGLRAAAR
jgi:predicted ATPase/DNA-binding SARP family transcriptional activator